MAIARVTGARSSGFVLVHLGRLGFGGKDAVSMGSGAEICSLPIC